MKQPGAFLPLAMSLAGIAMALAFVAMHGGTHSDALPHDERAPARFFQLLMVLQIPIVAYFAIRWFPRAPKKTLLILALQGWAWLAAIAIIVFLEKS